MILNQLPVNFIKTAHPTPVYIAINRKSLRARRAWQSLDWNNPKPSNQNHLSPCLPAFGGSTVEGIVTLSGVEGSKPTSQQTSRACAEPVEVLKN